MGYKIDQYARQTCQRCLWLLKKQTLQNENLTQPRNTILSDFAEFSKSKNIILSTTQKFQPIRNAVAERINGILKQEFGLK
jgi:hypothetical protein